MKAWWYLVFLKSMALLLSSSLGDETEDEDEEDEDEVEHVLVLEATVALGKRSV